MQPIDLNNLVEPYMDTGLYLAVTRDNTSVIGTGKTMRARLRRACHNASSQPESNGAQSAPLTLELCPISSDIPAFGFLLTNPLPPLFRRVIRFTIP